MGDILRIDFTTPRQQGGANTHQIRRIKKRLPKPVATPDEQPEERALAKCQTADPIKDPKDIERISDYLISKRRYRDNMLFIVGINFGLRYSDLSSLKFKDLIDENDCFKDKVVIFEKKTSTTRKNPKNRYITINDAVMDAVELYIDHKEDVKMDDYLFHDEKHPEYRNQPLNKSTASRVLKGIASDLGLDIRFTTHSLRKTFGYHQMMAANNDPRQLLLLQQMFNHSTPNQTLTYIGITQEEMATAYRNLNLGISREHRSLLDSQIVEADSAVM